VKHVKRAITRKSPPVKLPGKVSKEKGEPREDTKEEVAGLSLMHLFFEF